MRTIFHRGGQIFPLVIGVIDGILTALTLAAGRLVEGSQPLSTGLAFRISGAASLSGVFVFFTAEYIRLRGELVLSERQLNLTSGGRLATTRLGKAILIETVASAVVSSASNFLGALIPLIATTIVSWFAVAVALFFLAVLGVGAGRAVHGSPFVWALALVLAGGILTIAGMKFRIVEPFHMSTVALGRAPLLFAGGADTVGTDVVGLPFAGAVCLGPRICTFIDSRDSHWDTGHDGCWSPPLMAPIGADDSYECRTRRRQR